MGYDGDYFTRIIIHDSKVNSNELNETILNHSENEINEVNVEIDGADFGLREEYIAENGDVTATYHALKTYDNEK
ncbi:hypothetical protein [Halalkalibacter sp. APA_J-10(15)]|uniref:hypothetical protein n=1 Tax=Halalkalibacter sp. APA_J-10(15) TaxID=2933805 RepID=UPI001FF20A23|nr:hypothetical protein [Halalkalibacter sp. APA_J-10(15)]